VCVHGSQQGLWVPHLGFVQRTFDLRSSMNHVNGSQFPISFYTWTHEELIALASNSPPFDTVRPVSKRCTRIDDK
jgi:hypothetical protein